MKEIKLDKVSLELPTKLDEITEEKLNEMSNTIDIADNYSLVGIAYHETFSRILMSYRTKKQNIKAGVVPIFVKAGKTDSDFIKSAKVGSKVLISSNQIELGYRAVIKNNPYNLDVIMAKVDNNITPDEYHQIITDKEAQNVYFLDFKIVPNCDIIAIYK